MKNKKYNVAIYLRLSKEDLDNKKESESITNQRELLIDFVKDQGFNLCGEYVDDGISGTTFDREEFNRMIKDIEKEKINTVITKDLSRLGRDYIEAGRYVEKYFPEKGVRYISLLDGYDSEVENISDDMLPFKLLMNDMYAKDISKKVRSAITSKKKQGLFIGWKATYGYKKDPDNKHKLIIDEEASSIVKRIFEMAINKKSPKQIADILSSEDISNPSDYANLNRNKKTSSSSLWCSRTIDEMLINPTYAGHLTQGRRKKINYKSKKEIRTDYSKWIIKKNTHEPIIDEKIFDKVVEIRSKKNNYRRTSEYLLSGLLYCKDCGHSIGITRSKDKKRKYCGCNYYKKFSKFKLCTPHTLNYDKLEMAVLEDIKEICKTHVNNSKFKNIMKQHKSNDVVKSEYEKNIECSRTIINSLTNKLDKIYLDKIENLIDVEIYKRAHSKISNEIQNEKTKINTILDKLNSLDNRNKENENSHLKIIEDYLTFNKPNKNVINTIINKIEISKDKMIYIYYKFSV
jgi:Site-specific recombinases, DNA invertase Pin homologs